MTRGTTDPHAAIRHHALENVEETEAMETEDRLWWYLGRQAVVRGLLDRAAETGPISPILEIGCGSGGNLGLLARYGDVVGCEPSPVLAARARSRGVARAVHATDFFDLEGREQFGLVCCFDVLEHVADDAGFVARAAQLIRPGGYFLASVPAGPWLYSEHDRLLHHHRRYTRRGLVHLIESAHLQPVWSNYFVTTLWPAVAAARLKEKFLSRMGRKRSTVDIGRAPDVLNRILTKLLQAEAAVCLVAPLPVGVWTMALAVKRKENETSVPPEVQP